MLKFIIVSDTHYTINGIRPDKQDNVSKILSTNDIDCVLAVGDLTDVGADGSVDCVQGSCVKTNDELGSLRKNFVDVIDKHIDVYMCHGNHDTYTIGFWLNICNCCLSQKNYPVTNYIKDYNRRHKIDYYHENCYMFKKKNIRFISLGLYPDSSAIQFLKNVKIFSDTIFSEKIVIFFHFNMEGQYSDWWSDVEKETFYDTIKDLNILCICVGHRHETYSNIYWKNIRVLSGAGVNSLICTYENDTLSVNELV
jgi:predicted phosphodiesterase